MIQIDGSWGEGGGQIVRTALALSALSGQPIKISNIRSGRPKPGLKAQHVFCVDALRQLCGAKADGAKLGSHELMFYPGRLGGGKINIDIGTAGSVSLLLQAVLLPAIFASGDVVLRIKGGTAGRWAMPFEYAQAVFLPCLKRYCKRIEASLLKRGFYPAGGGCIELKIKPRWSMTDFDSFEEFLSAVRADVSKPVFLKRGALLLIKGISYASSDLQKAGVAERQARAARVELSRLGCAVKIEQQYSETLSSGSGICLWAVFDSDGEQILIGSDALGERGKMAEIVGREAAKRLMAEIEVGAVVDRHLADNLVPFLIFGGAFKTSEITAHCRTNVWVCEHFVGRIFNVDYEKKIVMVKC